jgi:hypothetical protein
MDLLLVVKIPVRISKAVFVYKPMQDPLKSVHKRSKIRVLKYTFNRN